MELSTLIFTLAFILPFFIQFHYLLEDPWKLCRAFHYYSSVSKQKIPKKPRLILHYPRLPSCNLTINSVNSISSTSLSNIRSALSTPVCHQLETLENKLNDENNLELEPSTSFKKLRTKTSMVNISKNNSCRQYLAKNSPNQLYGQSCSHTPAILNLVEHDSKDPKDIGVKSGLTDLIQDKPRSISNASIEYLYSRDLFLFEYRKRPNVKSEGIQCDIEGRSRPLRAWR